MIETLPVLTLILLTISLKTVSIAGSHYILITNFHARDCMKHVKPLLIAGLCFTIAGCAIHPKPMTNADRQARAFADISAMYANQEPVSQAINMHEAMARAIKYNLDNRLKLMETVLSGNELHLSGYDMLPQLAADAGFIGRSNKYVSFSENPSTGTVSGNSSTSEDQHRRVTNLQATWNVLDFGVSYIAAKQKSDAYLIAIERRRKMMQNVIRDVRYAYWRAVAAQRLQRALAPLRSQVNKALRQARTATKEKLKSPLETMQYEKSLLETQREIAALERDITNSKLELGALMNLKPGTHFTLVEPKSQGAPLPSNFPTDIRKLENIALVERPELREEDYRTRIAGNEIRKAMLRMLPGIELGGGWNYDSNSFLLNKAWANYGLQLTWNLMNIISAPARINSAKSAEQVAHFRRMALSMAILTQVDVAYLRYSQAKKELHVGSQLQNIDRKIYHQIKKEKSADKATQLQVIRARLSMVLSQLRYDLVYAEWQNSGGQLLNSIGYDPVNNINLNQDVQGMAMKLKQDLKRPRDFQMLMHAEAKPVTGKQPQLAAASKSTKASKNPAQLSLIEPNKIKAKLIALTTKKAATSSPIKQVNKKSGSTVASKTKSSPVSNKS